MVRGDGELWVRTGVVLARKESPRMHGEGSAVAVGIDAAVVANHHIVVRRAVAGEAGVVLEDFAAAPSLSGLARLTKRLGAYPGVMAVAEPTSMTWLPLSIALAEAGCSLALVGNRHSARLRSALAGKNKSDPIDAGVRGCAVGCLRARRGTQRVRSRRAA
jgi:hypothetical protein